MVVNGREIHFSWYHESFDYIGKREVKLYTKSSFELFGSYQNSGYILACLLRKSLCGILDETFSHKTYIYMVHKHGNVFLKTRRQQKLRVLKIGPFFSTPCTLAETHWCIWCSIENGYSICLEYDPIKTTCWGVQFVFLPSCKKIIYYYFKSYTMSALDECSGLVLTKVRF